MTYTAFATTAANEIGADAGISVFEQSSPYGISEATDEVARETVTDGSLDTADGDLDDEAAAALLARMGWQLAGAGWRQSGGQWAIEVERAEAPATVTLISAFTGDVVPGTDLADPDCPEIAGLLERPDVRAFLASEEYGPENPDGLVYIVTDGSPVPDGFPSLTVTP